MRTAIEKRSVKTKRILSSCAALLLAGAFFFAAPLYYSPRLGRDVYRSWFEHETEPTVGVISVWHIASFKPYSGSLGAWLNSRAKEYSSRFIGIHFEVRSMTPEQALEELEAGKKPDMISFREGALPSSLFMDPGTEPEAQPYCASGTVLIFDPSSENTDKEHLMELAGTPEEFEKGKAPSCVCDLRGAGDMHRKNLMGKAPYFEAIPLTVGGELIQRIGICSGPDETKLPYMTGLIEFVTGRESQETLPELGLIPVAEGISADFDPVFIKDMYSALFDADN